LHDAIKDLNELQNVEPEIEQVPQVPKMSMEVISKPAHERYPFTARAKATNKFMQRDVLFPHLWKK
jgi:hypothetical protein